MTQQLDTEKKRKRLHRESGRAFPTVVAFAVLIIVLVAMLGILLLGG